MAALDRLLWLLMIPPTAIVACSSNTVTRDIPAAEDVAPDITQDTAETDAFEDAPVLDADSVAIEVFSDAAEDVADVTPSDVFEVAPDILTDIVPDTPLDCTSPYVYLQDRQFRIGNEAFFPLSVNYIFDIRVTPQGEYFIAPGACFCDNPTFCCGDPASCRTAIREQLAQIKAMGMNSLRVVDLSIIPWGDSVALGSCSFQASTTDLWLCGDDRKIVMWPINEVGFQMIADAMDLVAEAGLKVIFLAGHGKVDLPGVQDAYTHYLTALATRFADNPTIFAYDLTNEPIYEFAEKGPSKQDVNTLFGKWYAAVRAGTTRQMVTAGLAEIGTVQTFDPGVMPLDFVSWHIYSGWTWDSYARNHLSSVFTWIRNEPYPSMVGETGISVEDDGATEADQAAFARHVLNYARACRSMGLQWWLYRDVHWGPPGEHFGLVRWDGTERPAADAFRVFDPYAAGTVACAPPPYTGSSPQEDIITQGRLIREDGTPIANGFVSGHKCFTGGWDWTITGSDGRFALLSGTAINEIKATASGMSTAMAYSLCAAIPDVGDIVLQKLSLPMDVSTPPVCP